MTVLSVIHCVQPLTDKTKDKVRQKFYMCTNMKASTHTTMLRINAYSRSHYDDWKEMKKVLQFDLCYHTIHTPHNTHTT